MPDKKIITRDWELISCDDVLAAFPDELEVCEATLVAAKYNEIIQQMPKAVSEVYIFVKINFEKLRGLVPFTYQKLEPLLETDEKDKER